MLGVLADRLRAEVPSARLILTAAQPAITPASPSIIILPVTRSPSGNQLIGGVSQRVRYTVGLLVTVTHAAEAATGGPALDVLEQVLAEIEKALLGWSPGAGWAPLLLAGGQIEQVEPGRLVWRDTWATERLARSANLL